MLHTFFNRNYTNTQVDVVLLMLRIGVGSMMLVHGLPKLEMLMAGGEVQFPGVMGMNPTLSLTLAVFAEFFCSILLILGLATRFATIPLIITMLIAVFVIHANDPFANQELGLHYLLTYLALLILGAGKFSVDAFLIRNVEKQQPKNSLK
ncbi:DoxX family protein [Salinimicrobium sp. MT39]|uniref:DoxX family protein n=1 Tax=Salinimicrobium profundisediminis TaxID=2994553 RepID=A0A9X3CZ86_9FLAO|nr:DoxX family protein [Salinimicrobium profundisediminis]MCX2839701.1 DoxX family protein [Salinimicrobium profundisediminis]